jgi:hypothetical protein
MSLAFMIGAVVVTLIGNIVIFRYLVNQPIDLPSIEE